MEAWVVSTFWLLWIMLLWTWGYKYLSEFLLSLLWGINPEVELLSHVVILCLFFEEQPYHFPHPPQFKSLPISLYPWQHLYFFFKGIPLFLLFIYLFLAVLGLHFCARAFSSCGKWGPLFIAVHGPLTIVASLVAEHRLQTCRLSSCGSRA